MMPGSSSTFPRCRWTRTARGWQLLVNPFLLLKVQELAGGFVGLVCLGAMLELEDELWILFQSAVLQTPEAAQEIAAREATTLLVGCLVDLQRSEHHEVGRIISVALGLMEADARASTEETWLVIDDKGRSHAGPFVCEGDASEWLQLRPDFRGRPVDVTVHLRFLSCRHQLLVSRTQPLFGKGISMSSSDATASIHLLPLPGGQHHAVLRLPSDLRAGDVEALAKIFDAILALEGLRLEVARRPECVAEPGGQP